MIHSDERMHAWLGKDLVSLACEPTGNIKTFLPVLHKFEQWKKLDQSIAYQRLSGLPPAMRHHVLGAVLYTSRAVTLTWFMAAIKSYIVLPSTSRQNDTECCVGVSASHAAN